MPGIGGHLRVHADRPCRHDGARARITNDTIERLRCPAVLDPIHELAQRVGRLCPWSATAVGHAWREEQSREVGRSLPVANQPLHALVVIDRPLREDQLVGQPVVDEELSARLLEATKIRVVRTHHVPEQVDRLPEQLVEAGVRRGRPIPGAPRDGRILLDPCPEILQDERERCADRLAIRGDRVADAGEARTGFEPVPQEFPGGAPRSLPDLRDNPRIGRGDRPARRTDPDQRSRVEPAGGRIADHAVHDPVPKRVTRLDSRGLERIELALRQEVAGLQHDQLRPERGRDVLLPVDRRRASKDPVEVRRIALRLREALAAARGATVPIGERRHGSVVGSGHRLAHNGQVMDAAVSEVLDQRPVELARLSSANEPSKGLPDLLPASVTAAAYPASTAPAMK